MSNAEENKRFSSVSEFLRSDDDLREIADQVEESAKRQKLVRKLAIARVRLGFSQSDLAKSMNVSQAKVSRIEASDDANLKLSDVVAYLGALDLSLRLSIAPKPVTLIDEIKFHAISVERKLNQLAEIAQSQEADESIQSGITEFIGKEVPGNFIRIMLAAIKKLPASVNKSIRSLVVDDYDEYDEHESELFGQEVEPAS